MHKLSAKISIIAIIALATMTFVSSLFLDQFVTTIFAGVTLCATGIYFVIKQFETIRPSIKLGADRRNQSSEHNTKQPEVSSEQNLDSTSHRDSESGLFDAEFFPVFIEQRISAARRTLRPVSLVTFEIDGLNPGQIASEDERKFYISSLGQVVIRTLRESDCAFRISGNTFAAVMDDTSEAGAVWAAERVRGVLHTGVLSGRVTVCAGVACYPSHALDPDELIMTSKNALENAKARGFDQVEIASTP